ncbi:MAG: Unknown protein [uncultured Thiotrichaceae bacterium]|uniref:Uncharacterized protein n=1 Tax=uncultured Thiotrichaceae bacterium TaxID=298394 RepID=A0A6S6TNJ2_9GAMM|nr:MAG: Unknown protein [uncultured Thiotrichaceae bacterium]
MSNLAKDLAKITGLKGAFLHSDGHPDIDTFSAKEAHEISSVLDFVEQYFSVAESINRSFNEMIFSLENGDNLITYLFDESTIFILRTEQKVNFPFVRMTSKIIAKKYLKGEYDRQPQKIKPSIAYKDVVIPEHLNQQPKTVPLVKEVLSIEKATNITSIEEPKRSGFLSRMKKALGNDEKAADDSSSTKTYSGPQT